VARTHDLDMTVSALVFGVQRCFLIFTSVPIPFEILFFRFRKSGIHVHNDHLVRTPLIG
jgi:hypothetical protein